MLRLFIFALAGLALARVPAKAQVESVPPPPEPARMASDGPVEVFAFGDVTPAGLGEALWAHDRDAALAAIDTTPTMLSPGVACVEAVLRDMALLSEYLPTEPPIDPLSARLFEDSRARMNRAFERALRAHQRCSAGASRIAGETIELVGPEGPTRVDLGRELDALRARATELVALAAEVESDELVRAYRALTLVLRLVREGGEDGIDLDITREPAETWATASAFYVVSHGRLPTPDETKIEPSWRLIPLLVGVLELSLGLALIPATVNSNGGLSDPRLRLGLVGISVSGIVSMILSPTWRERGRTRSVLASGLVVVAALGLGLGTALADVRPRLRAFGTALAASSLVDLAFWVGGVVVQRRWRPTASFSRHHGGLGCRLHF